MAPDDGDSDDERNQRGVRDFREHVRRGTDIERAEQHMRNAPEDDSSAAGAFATPVAAQGAVCPRAEPAALHRESRRFGVSDPDALRRHRGVGSPGALTTRRIRIRTRRADDAHE